MATDTIGQRFAQLIQHLGISKNAFAQSLNKTATVVQHLVDERNKPGYDLLCKVFEVYPQVSKDWLLLGQGPMLSTAASAASAGSATAKKPVLTAPGQAAPALATAVIAPPDPTLKGPAAPMVPTPAPSPESLTSAPAAPEAEKAAFLAVAAQPGAAEAVLTAGLHAQHLQHQLALAEQRNQHLLEQQRLMQQLLEMAQRR